MSVEARVTVLDSGAVIHDPRRLAAPPDAGWFDPAAWRAQGRLGDAARGRGTVHVVETPAGAAVLRHYRRGGLAARVSRDRYLYVGAERTRPFREFRVLAAAHAAGLRVPAPFAARFVRDGLCYRADILVEAIAGARTLAQWIADAAPAPPWTAIGRAVGALHGAGFDHADLNAHNVLIDAAGSVWIVDFDRARRRRAGGAWRTRNLARLERSLRKLGAPARIVDFGARAWPALRAAHREGLLAGSGRP